MFGGCIFIYMQNNDTNQNPNFDLKVGDTVAWGDANDPDLGHVGTVTRVLRSRRVNSRTLNVTVWAESPTVGRVQGPRRAFQKVGR